MERVALLALLIAGCGSSPPADPLVGRWSGMLTAAPAMDSQSEDWAFTADHTATRTNVIKYNDMIASVSGCTETIVFAFTSFTETGAAISIDGGLGTDEQTACSNPANDYPQKSLGTTPLTLTGTFSVSGDTLTLTLNNDTETYARR